MSLSDWTASGTSGTPPELDASVKYAGNSSVKFTVQYESTTQLTHNTFLENRAQIICWTRYNDQHGTPRVNMPSYGNLDCKGTNIDTWYKWRLSYWYESATDTKWGRRELWTGGEWVQQGTDTNFGSGAPSNCALILSAINIGAPYKLAWFDELEVYS